jgi:hypothetical protein
MTTVVRVAQAANAKVSSHTSLLLMAVMIPTVSVLTVTHAIEATVWSLVYWTVDAAALGANLAYFAFVNYTTLGYGDILPVQRWRLLGPITAMKSCCYLGGRPRLFLKCSGKVTAWFFLMPSSDEISGNNSSTRKLK